MLPDQLTTGLDLVICGTAAGARSALVGHYYAGPGNCFWRILAETGLTPRLLAPHEFRELSDFGIGLTDVAKGQAGNDVDIQFGAQDGATLRKAIELAQPRYLCFNGKRAAREFLRSKKVQYGIQEGVTIGSTILFVAPSTSGAAKKWWDASLWHVLAGLVRK